MIKTKAIGLKNVIATIAISVSLGCIVALTPEQINLSSISISKYVLMLGSIALSLIFFLLLRDIRSGIVWFPLASFFSNLNVILPIAIAGDEILILLTGMAVVFHLINNTMKYTRTNVKLVRLTSDSVLFTYLLFMISYYLSMISYIEIPPNQFAKSVFTTFLARGLFAYMVFCVIDKRKTIEDILKSFLWLSTAINIVFFITIIINNNYLYFRESQNRLLLSGNLWAQFIYTTAIWNANQLAYILLLLLPFLFVFAIHQAKSNWTYFLIRLGIICTVLSILLSLSFGGIITLLLSLGFITRRFMYSGEVRKILSLLVIGGIAVLFLVGPSMQTRSTDILNLEDSSLLRRIEQFKVGFYVFAQHPILGVGPGNASRIMAQANSLDALMTSKRNRNRPTYSVHSNFLLILMENGILGTVAFIGLLVAYFRYLHHVTKEAKSFYYKDILVATEISLISAFLLGFRALTIFNNLLWFIAALTFAIDKLNHYGLKKGRLEMDKVRGRSYI